MAEEIGEALIEVMPDLGDFADVLTDGVADASEEAAEAASDELAGITSASEEAAEGSVDAFADAGEGIVDAVESAADDADDALAEVAEAAEDSFAEVAEAGGDAFEGVAEQAEDTFADVGEQAEEAGAGVADAFAEASDDAADSLDGLADAGADSLDELAAAGETAGEGVADGVATASTSLDGLGGEAETAAADVEGAFADVDLATSVQASADDAEAALAGIADDAETAADDTIAAWEGVGDDIAAELDAVAGPAGEAGGHLDAAGEAADGARSSFLLLPGRVPAGALARVAAGGAVVAGALGLAAFQVEQFVDAQRPLLAELESIAEVIGVERDEMVDLAADMANPTRTVEELAALFRLATQRGAETVDELADFADFWDTVGDATGESAVALARAGRALAALDVDDPAEAVDALGFVFQETEASVAQFLGFVERVGRELGEQAPSVEQMAALLAAMEDEGLGAQQAQREVQQALRESEGDFDRAAAQLGITEQALADYLDDVEASGDVIADNAAIHARAQGPLDELSSGWDRLSTELGSALEEIGPSGDAVRDVADGAVEAARAFREGAEESGNLGGALASLATHLGFGSAAFGRMADNARSSMADLRDDVRGAIDAIVGWFADLPSRLVGALASLGAKLWVQGFTAMHSLWDGLKDVAGQVLSWVSDTASDIADKLDPRGWWSTPEEHYRELFGDAFAAIDDEARRGVPDLAALAGDRLGLAGVGLAGGLAAGGGGPAGGGATAGQVNVTVHQQPSETPVESTMRALRRTGYLSAAGRRGR